MTNNLQNALRCFLEDAAVTEKLALALATASGKGTVSYEEILNQSQEDTEDVLLSGFEWRLLLPVRANRCMEWDDRLLVIENGEIYQLPNVVKWLVDHAQQTGQWNPDHALEALFETMKDPFWQRIPLLVEKLLARASNYRINAVGIMESCREADLENRVDSLIAELKGSGVMSPRLGSLADMANARGGPLYELNPCLAYKSK